MSKLGDAVLGQKLTKIVNLDVEPFDGFLDGVDAGWFPYRCCSVKCTITLSSLTIQSPCRSVVLACDSSLDDHVTLPFVSL